MQSHDAVLVTGGAGYIGSHIVRRLGEAGRRVVTLDNLSTGRRDAVLDGELVVGDVGDRTLVDELLDGYQIGTVIHLAAAAVVPESVTYPLWYYENNASATRNLLECCQRAGVHRFLFSSTAAVYGTPEVSPVTENTPTAPINPYGRSKLMSEWMLRDLAAVAPLRYLILRYFNVAGAAPDASIGQATPEATHLVKVACEAATRKRGGVEIFGTDYPTPDGTGVRDYLHVEDLADAHVRAADYLAAGGEPATLNCGYGHGYSVREVLDVVRRVSGVDFPVREAPRRPGDPPTLVAEATRIRRLLDWTPGYDDLEVIVRTALAWERTLRSQPNDAA